VYPIEPGTNFLSRARPALYLALATYWTRKVAEMAPNHYGTKAAETALIHSGSAAEMAPNRWPT
jgi:hypothetical protein